MRTNYLINEPIILNANILEYDLSKANINALYSYGFLNDSEYSLLYELDKRSREIVIGKKIATKADDNNPYSDEEIDYKMKMAGAIKDGIMNAKRMLFESNNIKDEDVIRIANDAVYVNTPNPLSYTSFDINNNGKFLTFNLKNTFNIVLNLKRVSIFILDDPLSDSLNVDIKGINDELLYLHEPFIQFICEILSSMQTSDKPHTLQLFNSFYEPYIKRELPIEYYREFNFNSGYQINGCNYIVSDITEKDKDKISIDYNLSILREMYALILNR